MSEQEQDQQATEVETKAAETAAEAKTEAATETSAEAKTEAKAESKPKAAPDWRVEQLQRRVGQLTAQKKELEAAIAAKQAVGAAPSAADEEALAKLVEAKAATLAEQRAQQLVAQREFDEACTKAVAEGRSEYGESEFNERVSTLTQLRGDTPEDIQAYAAFVSAMLETGAPSKLIWELAGDLNEAHRLMRLSPLKQGIALAKLAAKEPEGITKAPKPITPLAAKGRTHSAIDPADRERGDSLSTAEWMARRNAQADEYNKRVGRRVL